MADPRALYPTPEPVVRVLLDALALGDPWELAILEPCAGDGAIVRALIAWGARPRSIDAVELVADDRFTRLIGTGAHTVHADALTWAPAQPPGLFDLAIANPPFGATVAFVRAVLPLVRPGGTVAMLERLAFLASAERLAFHREHPADVYVLTPRPSFVGAGTDASEYAWFVWTVGRREVGRVRHLPPWRESRAGRKRPGEAVAHG